LWTCIFFKADDCFRFTSQQVYKSQILDYRLQQRSWLWLRCWFRGCNGCCWSDCCCRCCSGWCCCFRGRSLPRRLSRSDCFDWRRRSNHWGCSRFDRWGWHPIPRSWVRPRRPDLRFRRARDRLGPEGCNPCLRGSSVCCRTVKMKKWKK